PGTRDHGRDDRGNRAMSVLELRGASRTYVGTNPLTALYPTDVAIRAGELVGVVGPSGSGKSTLLYLLGTLDRPTTGSIRLAGREATAVDDRWLAALPADHVGFVFQRFPPPHGLPALENVATGLLYREPSARKRRQAARR